MSRRVFLGAVVGAGAVVLPLGRAASAGAATSTVYRLNPSWGDGDPACVPNRGRSTCGGCSACVGHGANKLFASAVAADAGRAHPGCKCRVEAACEIETTSYDELFAGGASADLRTPAVADLYVCATSVTTPTGGPADPVLASAGAGSGNASPGALVRADGSPGGFAATGTTSPTAFGVTGASVRPVALAGAAIAALGVVLLRVRRQDPRS